MNISFGALLASFSTLVALSVPLSAQTAAEAMDAPGMEWTSTGSLGWRTVTVGEAFDGVDALECFVNDREGTPAGRGVLYPGNVGARLETNVAGPAVVSFRWLAPDAGVNLLFRVDGVLMGQSQVPEQQWQQAMVNLPAGVHRLEWQAHRSRDIYLGGKVRLDQLVVSAGGTWDLPGALEDPDGVWVSLSAARTAVSAAAAGPQGGSGVSLLGNAGVWQGQLSRLVEGPVTAEWAWRGFGPPEVDLDELDAHLDTCLEDPPYSEREPLAGTWTTSRLTLPAGPQKRAVVFHFRFDETEGDLMVPVVNLDRFRVVPSTLSSQINLPGLNWTEAGPSPWVATPGLFSAERGPSGSLKIPGAAPGQMFSLNTQITGPKLLAWLDSTSSPLDRFTAALDGQPAATPLVLPLWKLSGHCLEIPAGVHQVSISLIIGGSPTLEGQTRGGLIGGFQLLPVQAGGMNTALGLGGATKVYADAAWTVAAPGALRSVGLNAREPLYIPVTGPAMVRVPLEWLPAAASGDDAGLVNEWLEVPAGRHLVDLSQPHFYYAEGMVRRMAPPEIYPAGLTGPDAAAAALDVVPAAILGDTQGIPLMLSSSGATGGDALLLRSFQTVRLLAQGPGDLRLRAMLHGSGAPAMFASVNGFSYGGLTQPSGNGWTESVIPLGPGSHVILVQGGDLLLDDVQLTPAPVLPVAEALDHSTGGWRVTGPVAGFAGDGAGGDYAVLADSDSRVETDVTGPVLATIMCRNARYVKAKIGTMPAMTQEDPRTNGWWPLRVYLPAGATTLGFFGDYNIHLDDYRTGPAPPLASALDFGGQVYAASAGGVWSIAPDATAVGGSTLRIDLPDPGSNGRLVIPVAGPAVVRWRQRCSGTPGCGISNATDPFLEQPTPDWRDNAAVVVAGGQLDLNVYRNQQGSGQSLLLDHFQVQPIGQALGAALGYPELAWTTSPERLWVPADLLPGQTSAYGDEPGVHVWKTASAAVADRSWLETELTGPGTVEWKVAFPLTPLFGPPTSFQSSCRLEIDGQDCGPATAVRRAHFGPGTHRVRWTVQRGSRDPDVPQALLSNLKVNGVAAPGIPVAFGTPSLVWLDDTAGAYDVLPAGGPNGRTAIRAASGGASGTAVVTGPCRLSWQAMGSGSLWMSGYPVLTGGSTWQTRSIWLNPGTHWITFTASDLRLSGMETDPGDPYALWLAGYFPAYAVNTALLHPGFDVDYDGIPNLVEFALGLDPATQGSLPTPSMTTTATGFAFTLPLPPGRSAPDIAWLPATSHDLSSWSPLTGLPGVTISESPRSIIVTVPRARLGDGTRGFFRLGADVPR